MSFGSFLRQATSSKSWRVCAFPRDPGPSTFCIHTCAHPFRSQLYSRAAFATVRTLHSSPIPLLPRPSRSARHPRWINSRRNSQRDGGADAAVANEEQEDVSDDKNRDTFNEHARMDGEEDESNRSSSSHSSPNGDSNGAEQPPPPVPPGSSSPPHQTSISKQSVPEVYPQVLALPIARRPLFPGFYKAVVVRNPGVVAAIKEMMKRGQPYLGAFLLKDENTDSDVITDINSVHPVGVFAQITSVFAATGKDDKEEGLTAVLYPHRRIRITELVKSGVSPSAISATVEPVTGEVIEPVTVMSESAVADGKGTVGTSLFFVTSITSSYIVNSPITNCILKGL